ncbi:CvpA family protein [Blastochloris tepida]|jgi:membrane protein required for colicin V production|uniref:Colicin V biosynthesis protein n=1 Tax=Blastochloris tepida TaxID=2233851 RepID=A0A348G425_9HYPH|nr:CvpA family protein [Blastochloris tepida]BBF94308.1 colicin V biosynthesis protein [Blastochloris tepida]
MPLTPLDIALLVIMLISGLLAMVRGLVRELFSIGSWIAAGAAAAVFYPQVLPFARQYISHDTLALAASAAGIFLVTLLVVWILTAQISDAILDSRIGALDRSLGFVFGLGRGLIVMVVAFLFLTWLLEDKQPAWIKEAKSYTVLRSTGDWLMSLLPDDPEAMLRNLKPPKDDAEPAAQPRPPGTKP